MNPTSVKTRHYGALASRLKSLQVNLEESESQFLALAEQLQAMSRLGANHASQFMAISRLLDKELEEAAAKELSAAEQQLAAQQGHL